MDFHDTLKVNGLDFPSTIHSSEPSKARTGTSGSSQEVVERSMVEATSVVEDFVYEEHGE